MAVLDRDGENRLELVGLSVQTATHGAAVVLGLGHVVLARVDGLVDTDQVYFVLVALVELIVVAMIKYIKFK